MGKMVAALAFAGFADLETDSLLSTHMSLWFSGDGQLSGCDPLSRG